MKDEDIYVEDCFFIRPPLDADGKVIATKEDERKKLNPPKLSSPV